MRNRTAILLQTVAFGVAGAIGAQLISYFGGTMFGDWRLVLQGLQESSKFWGLVIAFVLAVACILLLFQYERRLVARSLGNTLMALRLAGILVLFLALLEPIWTWSYEDERTGRVIVAIDASESMDTVDEFATRAEKLRWAKALGLVTASEQIDRWIKAFEAGEEPEWVTENETSDPVRRDQLTRARKENVDSLCREVDKLSRKEIARRIVVQRPEPLLDKLSKYAQSSLMLFAGKTVDTKPEEIEKLLAQPELDVDREHSDLTQPLNAGLAGPADPPLAGIVLISDGRDTAHPDMNDFLSRVTGLGVPIHTVLVGSNRRPRDLSVMALDYPESVFKADTPVVKAILHQSGFDGQQANVLLESIDPENPAEPLTQLVPLNTESVEVSFPLKDLPAGLHRYRLRIEPQEDETRDDNNERELAIQVVDDKADVLLVDGEARWEFRYLEAALSRDEQVELHTVLFDQPYINVLSTTFFPRKLAIGKMEAARGNEPAASPFKDFDVVIVGDVSPQQLGVDGWNALEHYVREEGGTLVLIAGQRHLPAAYTTRQLEALLPIESPRVMALNNAAQLGPPHSRGFKLQVTHDGSLQDMFLMDADPLQNQRIWESLPGHPWGVVGQVKAAATVWAAALAPGEPTGLDAERQNAIIAQHYVGDGQVVWIGIDSTWRWRLRVGDVYHHRFWGQLARWSVDFKATDTSGVAKFGLVKPIISQTEEAVFRVRWDDRFLKQHPQAKGQVVLAPTGEHEPAEEITLDLRAAGRRGQMEARVGKLKPGQYRAKLIIEGAQIATQLAPAELTVNREITAELKDISANRELLSEMASVTGGKFFTPDQIDEIPELFSNVTQRTSIHEEIPLYSHWSVLALFALFMTAEWVLRKLNGLP